MRLYWKPFTIDLNSFNVFLKNNITKADGISAEPDYFDIIESQPFEPQDIDIINNYYNSLNEEEELIKLQRPILLREAILSCKNNMLTKNYFELGITERKLLLSLPLTEEDEEHLILTY